MHRLQGKIHTVEAARGVAAIAVVLFHLNSAAKHAGLQTSTLLAPFQYGVDFFFVLSGFIILYAHRGDIGRSGSIGPYLIKRAIRLLPMLWLVAGLYIVLRLLLGETPSAASIGTSLLLYPSVAEPLPLPVWTLRHEALFYVAFGLLILHRRIGLAVFGVWAVATLGQMLLIASGKPLTGWPSLVFSSFVLDFLMGAAVAHLARNGVPDTWKPLLAGILMVLAYAVATVMLPIDRLNTLDYTSMGNLFVPLNGLAFAVFLYGLLCVELRVKMPRWALLLGGASYAIYLSHTIANGFSQRIAVHMGNGAGHVLILVVGIAGGIILHLLVEKPITNLLRRRLLPLRFQVSEQQSFSATHGNADPVSQSADDRAAPPR